LVTVKDSRMSAISGRWGRREKKGVALLGAYPPPRPNHENRIIWGALSDGGENSMPPSQ